MHAPWPHSAPLTDPYPPPPPLTLNVQHIPIAVQHIGLGEGFVGEEWVGCKGEHNREALQGGEASLVKKGLGATVNATVKLCREEVALCYAQQCLLQRYRHHRTQIYIHHLLSAAAEPWHAAEP
jgi:hypothetical protein